MFRIESLLPQDLEPAVQEKKDEETPGNTLTGTRFLLVGLVSYSSIFHIGIDHLLSSSDSDPFVLVIGQDYNTLHSAVVRESDSFLARQGGKGRVRNLTDRMAFK